MTAKSSQDYHCKRRVPINAARKQMYLRQREGKIEPNRSFLQMSHRDEKKSDSKTGDCMNKDSDCRLLRNTRINVVSPPTPTISPETSMVLDNAEQIARDALLQIKEFETLLNQKHAKSNLYWFADDVPFDDETDELLYARERITSKLHDTKHNQSEVHDELFRSEDSFPNIDKLKTSTNSFPSKFRSCKKFYDVLFKNDEFEQEKKTVSSLDEAQSSNLNSGKSVGSNVSQSTKQHISVSPVSQKKIGTLNVQSGPTVNIQRDLKTQKLKDVHISPDPSHIQECENTGIYEFQFGMHQEEVPPKNRKKYVKILGVSNTTKGDDSINSGDVLRKDEIDEQALLQNEAITHKPTNFEHSTNISQSSNECISLPADIVEQKPSETLDEQHSHRNSVKTNEEQHKKQTRKTDKKLVNEERGLISNVAEVLIAQEPTKETDRKLGECCETGKTSKNQVEEKNNSEQLVSINKDDEQNFANVEKQKKDCNEREAYFETIDDQFRNIPKTYCYEEKSNASQISFQIESSLDCLIEDLDYDINDLDLYHPSINELDNLLVAHDKEIENVAREMKMIEEFLSRPEIMQYCNLNNRIDLNAARNLNPSATLRSISNEQDEQVNFAAKHLSDLNEVCAMNSVRMVPNKSKDTVIFQKGNQHKKQSRMISAARNQAIVSRIETVRPQFKTKQPRFNLLPITKQNSIEQKTIDDPEAKDLLVTSKSDSTLSSMSSTSTSTEDRVQNRSHIRKIGNRSTCISSINKVTEESNDLKRNIDFSTIHDMGESSILKQLLFKLQDNSKVSEQLRLHLSVKENSDKELEENFRKEETSYSNKSLNSDITHEKNVTGRKDKSKSLSSSVENVADCSKSREREIEEVALIEDHKTEENENYDQKPVEENSICEQSHRIIPNIEQLNSDRLQENNQVELLPVHESTRTENKLYKITNFNTASLENISEIKHIGNDIRGKNVLYSQSCSPVSSENGNERKEIYLVKNNATSVKNTANNNSKPRGCDISVQTQFSSNDYLPLSPTSSIKDCDNVLRNNEKTLNNPPSSVFSSESNASSNQYQREYFVNHKNEKSLQLAGEFISTKPDNLNEEPTATCKAIPGLSYKNHDVLSDLSHSEGELYMPSSGSYSLGEVRVLRKNNAASDTVTEAVADDTVLVTKSMLISWSETSNSTSDSTGEI